MPVFISKISSVCGRIAAWLYFAIGCIIIFEIVARYAFLKPTIWVEEMSRFLQIWATYLAAAYVLKNRKLIAITVVRDRLPRYFRIISEAISLTLIAVFSMVAVWYGSTTVLDSIRIGRASSTMLGVPLWMTELAIPVGFSLLFFQVLTEIVQLFYGPDITCEEGGRK
ncbi:TRAP transporter small permease [Desulforhopalus sp. IMCC35007]|uniref:TRAP transporter small permease n=1 Tax=Desulforhopalus sp. IMCC35007 TaxID=2569543 RepID=UPI0010AE912B|nr:TRAP transporter small permease [Desulforhopalus sp. IMCC35007]TKB06535.1 TRAP transporter small permease [Desulforhopalus sp. IMCC35007]